MGPTCCQVVTCQSCNLPCAPLRNESNCVAQGSVSFHRACRLWKRERKLLPAASASPTLTFDLKSRRTIVAVGTVRSPLIWPWHPPTSRQEEAPAGPVTGRTGLTLSTGGIPVMSMRAVDLGPEAELQDWICKTGLQHLDIRLCRPDFCIRPCWASAKAANGECSNCTPGTLCIAKSVEFTEDEVPSAAH